MRDAGGFGGGPFFMAKTEVFQRGALYVSRHTTREGPSPYFVALYRNTCQGFMTPKDVLRWLKLGKSSETRAELVAWFESFEQKPAQPPEKT